MQKIIVVTSISIKYKTILTTLLTLGVSCMYATHEGKVQDPVTCVKKHYKKIEDLLRPATFDLEKLRQAEKDGETTFSCGMIFSLKNAENIDKALDALELIKRYQREYFHEILAVEKYLKTKKNF